MTFLDTWLDSGENADELFIAPLEDEVLEPAEPPARETLRDHVCDIPLDARREVEGQAVVPMKKSPEPTAAEREAHEVAHLPFRAWCATCVEARAKES